MSRVKEAKIKGWCPSAHAPMMSGDGLLVRVKPQVGRLTVAQAQTLCDLAERFGNGMIDLTSRANLQVRGVTLEDHPALLEALITEGLVDPDPSRAAQNLTVTPFWQAGDLTDRLAQALIPVALPPLPDKMGTVLDAGQHPVLTGVSGDFRFEQSAACELLLRADGASKGRIIAEDQAGPALEEMADWFLTTGGAEAGRMARHLTQNSLPDGWQQVSPARHNTLPPDQSTYGVPFGQIEARALKSLLDQSDASHLRVTPWRKLILENAKPTRHPAFLSPNDPLMRVSACPGQPACAEATIETRAIARAIAETGRTDLHVSGCAKGCARQTPAALTVVGRNGRFDLVQDGRAGDTPVEQGLTKPQLLEFVG